MVWRGSIRTAFYDREICKNGWLKVQAVIWSSFLCKMYPSRIVHKVKIQTIRGIVAIWFVDENSSTWLLRPFIVSELFRKKGRIDCAKDHPICQKTLLWWLYTSNVYKTITRVSHSSPMLSCAKFTFLGSFWLTSSWLSLGNRMWQFCYGSFFHVYQKS